MRRLVIVLPFYHSDREACMRMARYVCALEDKYRDDVELCFCNRWDTDPLHPGEMMRFVATFKVSWFPSTTKAEGHPKGCNAMARDIFHEALRRSNVGGPWEDVEALLFMEPDCVPVAKDWIDQLRAAWDRKDDHALVVGCYRDRDVDVPHVNGNALWSPRLAAHINIDVDCHGFGWDSALAEQIASRFCDTPLIANLFKETNVPESRMRNNPFNSFGVPVLLHGVKDDSATKYAEKCTGVRFPT